jgi:hypothetical protein
LEIEAAAAAAAAVGDDVGSAVHAVKGISLP